MTELWNYKTDDLTKTTNSKTTLKANTVDCFKITEAYFQHSTKSDATAIALRFENDFYRFRTSIWFRGKAGNALEFGVQKLNKLTYLCKLKATDLKSTTRKVKNYAGQEIEREYLDAFKEKEVGLCVRVTADENGLQYNIEELFEPKSRKTSAEIQLKQEPVAVKYFEEKYTKQQAAKEPKQTDYIEPTITDDSEFPF